MFLFLLYANAFYIRYMFLSFRYNSKAVRSNIIWQETCSLITGFYLTLNNVVEIIIQY